MLGGTRRGGDPKPFMTDEKRDRITTHHVKTGGSRKGSMGEGDVGREQG